MDTRTITELGRIRNQVERLDVDEAVKTKLRQHLDAEVRAALDKPERARPPRRAKR